MKKIGSFFKSLGDKRSRRDSARFSSSETAGRAPILETLPTGIHLPHTQAGPSTAAAPDPPVDDEFSFSLRVDKKMWPAFDLGEDTSDLFQAAGQIHIDYTDRPAGRWAKGLQLGPMSGAPLFADSGKAVDPSHLPPLLFDLRLNRTVKSSEADASNYFVISHVWGETIEVDGAKYGVSWKIPVRNQQKLSQMLEAARVVVGLRYVWVDILCLDQSTFNGKEVECMERYFAHAVGCFVWLDNTYDDPAWSEVLNAIAKVNSFFKLDVHGTPEPGALEQMFQQGGSGGLGLKMNGTEAIRWNREMSKLGNASWFRRVWTLQEGVIPDKVYFCTPERYMTAGSFIWTLSSLCEMIVASFLQTGSLHGTAINHELQRSEVHKMLKLRQAYRRRKISYWHLVQATRSRECHNELDRVYGVSGLIHGPKPIVDYNKPIGRLYRELYSGYVNAGDFGPCLFLGGKSILPERHVSMGSVMPVANGGIETHTLCLTTDDRLQMGGVGAASITKVYCIFTASDAMKAWQSRFPDLLGLSEEVAVDVAKAFGLETTLYKDTGICPAAFAAILSNGDQSRIDAVAKLFDAEFQDLLYGNVPKATLQWIKITYFMQDRADSALVLVWTTASEAQLAVVTEPVEGTVFVITPSSYVNDPGPGCLLCKVLDDGTVRKIGLGLGKVVKADRLADCVLVE
jgi:hypothetical protein